MRGAPPDPRLLSCHDLGLRFVGRTGPTPPPPSPPPLSPPPPSPPPPSPRPLRRTTAADGLSARSIASSISSSSASAASAWLSAITSEKEASPRTRVSRCARRERGEDGEEEAYLSTRLTGALHALRQHLATLLVSKVRAEVRLCSLVVNPRGGAGHPSLCRGVYCLCEAKGGRDGAAREYVRGCAV